MHLTTILVIVFVACLFQASVGFGSNLIAMPIVVQLDPDLVPGAVMVASALLNVMVMIRDRQHVELRPVAAAAFGAAAGTGVAALILRQLSDRGLGVLVGLCVLAMVAITAFGRPPARSTRNLAIAGTAAGFSGTAAGIGGPPVVLLYQDADAGPLRGSLAGFFLATSALSFAGLHLAGRFGTEQLAAGAILVPAAVAAFVASKPLLRVIDRRMIRPAILTLSTTAAAVLLTRSLLG